MSDKWFVAWTAGISILLLIGIIYILALENKTWKQFAREHQCKLVGKSSGDTAPTIGSAVGPNGQVSIVVGVTTTPGKTGYLCDDGVTYWR